MTQLIRFSDHLIKGKWARIKLASDQWCYIAVGPRSVVLKQSKTGLTGPRLFEIRQLSEVEKIAILFGQQFPEDLTPVEMTNCLLKPIVNAMLHCNSLDDVLTLFNTSQLEVI